MKRALATVLIFTTLLASQSLAAESNASLWQMISQGGWAMIPLGITSLVLIYLILHCFRETAAKNFSSQNHAARLIDLCADRRFDEAQEAAKNDANLLSRATAAALEKFQKSPAQTEEIDTAISDTLDLEEHAINQWIQYLAVVATVAPMVGLLGTVSGMIGAFQTMSSGGMGRPELLAGDIGEALITTATGLSIGIPAMIFHSYFSNRLENQLVATSQQASLITESLKEQTPSH